MPATPLPANVVTAKGDETSILRMRLLFSSQMNNETAVCPSLEVWKRTCRSEVNWASVPVGLSAYPATEPAAVDTPDDVVIRRTRF